MFIYLITNTVNGKQYIGKTIKPVHKRLKEHQYRSKCEGTKNRQYLTKAMIKHGIENFSIEQIYEASSFNELSQKEIEFINKHNTLAPNGYNLSFGGEGVLPTQEIKDKISKSNTGKKRSEHSKNKMRIAKIGKKHTQEHINKCSIAKRKNPIFGINIKDGSKIEFNFLKEANKYGFHSGHISGCISGLRKSHKGYRWFRCQPS